jgi:hypothetical protein
MTDEERKVYMTRNNYGYSDLPTTSDELGIAPSAGALSEIIHHTAVQDTPLTVGIYGPWGSGKTSLMQMIYSTLDEHRCIPIWFDAWRYAQSDTLWRALLLAVVDELRLFVKRDNTWLRDYIGYQNRLDPDGAQVGTDATALAEQRDILTTRLDDLVAQLYRSVERDEPGEVQVQWDRAGKLVGNILIRAGFDYIPGLSAFSTAVDKAREAMGEEDYATRIANLFQRQQTRIYREQVRSLEQFYRHLKQVVQQWITSTGRRLVVFIDDLDRCLPEQAVGVLEALKVFLDAQGCIFVLGVDRDVIERGIHVRYQEFALASNAETPAGVFPIEGRDYLEKIVQIPFELPPLEAAVIQTFLHNRLPAVAALNENDEDVGHIARVMTAGLLRNPRKVKRTFNTFRVHLTLDRAYGRATAAGLIAKLVVIQSSFASVYEYITHEPTALRDIERIVRGTPGAGAIQQPLRDIVAASDPRLKEMLYMQPFFEECADEELRELVYRSRITREGGEKVSA